MISAPQVSLLCRPLPSPPLYLPPKRLPFPPCSLRRSSPSAGLVSFPTSKPRSHRRRLLAPRALPPEHASFDLEPFSSRQDPFSNFDPPQSSDLSQETSGESSRPEIKEAGEAGAGADAAFAAESPAGGSGGAVERQGMENRLPLVVFLMGVLASLRRGLDRVAASEWASWLPFWPQERRLERLIAEADASPKDVAKQNALLAELNKHSPESVIRRFEERSHAVDSKGVAEYLRALVVTNALAEYLPDERSGKPSSLPTLLQELKQRASGNEDEPFLNPGLSEKHPLHVVMVDPKASSKSTRFAQELLSTILFTVVIGLMWVMGAAALQKYIGGLGGIGTSGVGSSATYAPKELNKEITPEKNVKTFKDVKGCDDAKQELEEVVEYLKNPSKFTRLGGKLPKGILLTGAPGTGKTLLAKAIAGEAGVPFFYRAGSEFEEMFVGVGARRVRSLFQAAKKKAPCIIFIDEIDAVGSTRKQWEGHTKKTLHQLLVEMDGFEQNEGIILMAATNLPDILDPALTRPGRFDRHFLSLFSLKDRILTKIQLQRRNHPNATDLSCTLCNGGRESVEHLLLHCPFSKRIWKSIRSKLGIKGHPGSLKSLWTTWRLLRVKKPIRSAWDLIVIGTCWAIWKERNARVFQAKTKTWQATLYYILDLIRGWSAGFPKCSKDVIDPVIVSLS